MLLSQAYNFNPSALSFQYLHIIQTNFISYDPNDQDTWNASNWQLSFVQGSLLETLPISRVALGHLTSDLSYSTFQQRGSSVLRETSTAVDLTSVLYIP